MHSRLLASDALGIFLLNGYGLTNKSREARFLHRVKILKPGEVVIRYGSKVIFQYLKNQDGAVVIDFKRIND